MRGYPVMRGYWQDPEATATAIDAGDWMHTGDLARMDEDGYVAVIGRIKDMIIRGGENIYPRGSRKLLDQHPDIVSAQVVGVPDERYGEEVMAWIRLQSGASLDAEAVRQFCAERLAHYKAPRYVQFLAADEDFPMTVTGKVKKNLLRDRAVAILQDV